MKYILLSILLVLVLTQSDGQSDKVGKPTGQTVGKPKEECKWSCVPKNQCLNNKRYRHQPAYDKDCQQYSENHICCASNSKGSIPVQLPEQ